MRTSSITTFQMFLGTICLCIGIVCAVGWVKNIVKLTQCDFEAPYKAEVLHTIGIIPVVGAFTGYMDFGK